MKAILADPKTSGKLVLGDVIQPVAANNQALVRVKAVSLNRGEVRRAMTTEKKYVPGWDLAGVVEAAAADGSGPKVGERVVGIMPEGAWAELAAVQTGNLAVQPESVSFSQAATFPVAGLTALYVLRRAGSVLGQKVLVTGASGGAGNFLVQLANLSGAAVVGITHHTEYAASVREAGAAEVVVGNPEEAARFGPYHLIADAVGGPLLSAIFGMLAPGGFCVNYGTTGGPEVTVNLRALFGAPGASFSGFYLFAELKNIPARTGLEILGSLTADGRLRPRIEVEAPWTEVAEVARKLMEREFAGKAVLLL